MISVTGEVIDGEIDRTGVLAGVGRSLGDLDFACKCIARLGELARFQSVGEGDLVGAARFTDPDCTVLLPRALDSTCADSLLGAKPPNTVSCVLSVMISQPSLP